MSESDARGRSISTCEASRAPRTLTFRTRSKFSLVMSLKASQDRRRELRQQQPPPCPSAAACLSLSGDEVTQDRKSTRLTTVTNAHLVCRLLIEQKKTQLSTNTTLPTTYHTIN